MEALHQKVPGFKDIMQYLHTINFYFHFNYNFFMTKVNPIRKTFAKFIFPSFSKRLHPSKHTPKYKIENYNIYMFIQKFTLQKDTYHDTTQLKIMSKT